MKVSRPFLPVQLRLMLDRGLVKMNDYCQPESGGASRVLRDLFNDPATFLITSRPYSNATKSSDRSLDPYASGNVPLMGDTLPIQADSRYFSTIALRDSPPISLNHRNSRFPHPEKSDVILDATDIDLPQDRVEAETVYHGHPSFLSYTRCIFCVVLAAVAGALMLPFSGVATAAGAGLAFLILVGVWADRSFADYIVTTRRVEVITGILSRSSNEVKVSDIRSINVVKKGFLGFLGIGTVEFASAGGDDVEVSFTNIFGTHRVKDIVRKLQDAS